MGVLHIKMLSNCFLYALIERLAVVMGKNDKGKAYKSSILPKLYAAYSVWLTKNQLFCSKFHAKGI
jgi:hypothetical protein